MEQVKNKYGDTCNSEHKYAIQFKFRREKKTRGFTSYWKKYKTMKACLQGLKDLREHYKGGCGKTSHDGGKTWCQDYIIFRPVHYYYQWE